MEETKKSTTLGLDLGIASVGWCLFENDDEGNSKRIIDLGSFVFDQIEDGKTGETENVARREKRSMRRQRRRRVRRLADARNLFKDELDVDFQEVINSKTISLSPFEIKVKGLNEKLSKEELSIALYHYLKHRGYKSNRKTEFNADKIKKSDDSKMLGGIQTVRKQLEESNGKHITNLLLDNFNSKSQADRRIHNTDSEYLLTVSRDMYLDEINALLNKQISYGLITDDFKNKYITLFLRQRDFSEGPGVAYIDKNGNKVYSKYHIDMDQIIGTCEFDGLARAPKDSVTAKRFVLLSSLVNLRYKTSYETDYESLTPNQIKTIEDVALDKSELKYSAIFKTLKINPVKVKGLTLSRKQYKTVIKKFSETEGLREDDALTEAQSQKLANQITKATFDKTIFKNSSIYLTLKKDLTSKGITHNDDFYDAVAEILLRNKTDKAIEKECVKHGFTKNDIECIEECDECKETINLSVELCKKLLNHLRDGQTYDEAMEAEHINHSQKARNNEIAPELPEINTALKGMGVRLMNPVVKHSLVQMRKVINAVIHEYGAPTNYSIELARELKKSFEDRREILNEQLENQTNNILAKTEILEKFGDKFSSIRSVTRDALLRYRLFKQQGGVSPYTNKLIRESDIFDDNEYQIDHILPYSRSFNDSINNKVLVETKANQEKRNRTPIEWLGTNSSTINKYLESHHLPFAKQRNLLAKAIEQEEFLSKDLNDTSYLSRLAKQMIEFYLLPEGHYCRTISGKITETLRRVWGLSGKTHSYYASHENNLYEAKAVNDYLYEDFSKDENETTIQFNFTLRGQILSFVFEKKKGKGKDKKLSKEDQHFNSKFESFIKNVTFYKQRFEECGCKGKQIDTLYQSINYQSINDLSSERKEAGLFFLSLCFNEIQDDINKKNRDNDLHHALDAAVIAQATPKIGQRITKFYQYQEGIKTDLKTGEIIMPNIPFPYEDFKDELLTRVYERDETKLISYLNSLSNYQRNPATRKNVHVMWPVRLPKKDIIGAISGETVFGMNKRDGSLTKTISVDKLDAKKLEKIVDKDGGNKAVYEACKTWLSQNDGSKYPILAKKGTYVKSVKITYANDVQGKVDLSNNKYADNSSVVRVDVFKKNNDSKTIYMVPIYYYQIQKINRGIEDVSFTVMWKQGEEGSTFLTLSELKNNYVKIATMPLRSIIELSKGNSKVLAYSGGCTSGVFEVYSILGDGVDLVISGCFDSFRKQYTSTISTITGIKVHSISVLGKIR